jgi:hypothetical protein
MIEMLIGLYAHDEIIRPYGGDFLVVILLYCLVRAFLRLPVLPVAGSILLFSYFVEWTQYIKLADRLHLGRHSVARVLLGDYFTWVDIGCYTLGILTILSLERLKSLKDVDRRGRQSPVGY